jgi:hypothetical protein
MLCQLSYAVRSVRVCDISELSLVPSISMQSSNHDFFLCWCYVLRWMSVMLLSVYIHTEQAWKKVVGSIPTVARHIFQACPMWIYTQSNITNIIIQGTVTVACVIDSNSFLKLVPWVYDVGYCNCCSYLGQNVFHQRTWNILVYYFIRDVLLVFFVTGLSSLESWIDLRSLYVTSLSNNEALNVNCWDFCPVFIPCHKL